MPSDFLAIALALIVTASVQSSQRAQQKRIEMKHLSMRPSVTAGPPFRSLGPRYWKFENFLSGALVGWPILAAQQPAPELDLKRGLAQSDNRVETRHLTATMSASAVAAQGRVTLFVDVTPKPKMHVYSPEQKDVIPVSLTVVGSDTIRGGTTKYPKSEKYFFAPLKETQFVYSQPFRLSHEVTLTMPAREPVTIKGTLRYQACDDAVCYMPQNVALSWTIRR